MTKRRPKKHTLDGVAGDHPYSGRVFMADREDFTVDTGLALWEQLFEMQASEDDIAKLLVSELRKEPPSKFLNMLVLMLDPEINSYFKLAIKRRRGGDMWTRRANDAALAKFARKYQRALGNKRGTLKEAVGRTADRFKISEATVRQALRNSK
jgi:hypothetical protein